MTIEPATFELANYLEAVLWGIIALGFAWHARHAATRGRSLLAAIAFVLFGLSDVVEVRTGAWWRPWWLLLWKGGCLIVFLSLLIGHRRAARKAAGHSSNEETAH